MSSDEILGSWKSVYYADMFGNAQKYDRQELTFYANGTGNMHARTLFKRNTPFTWESTRYSIYIYNLGGPGSVAEAEVDGNELGVVENGMLMVYVRK